MSLPLPRRMRGERATRECGGQTQTQTQRTIITSMLLPMMSQYTSMP